MILGALEGKDRSLDASTRAETHQTSAAPPAISKGLGYVNKTKVIFLMLFLKKSIGINLSSADVFSVWKLVMIYSVNFVLEHSIKI